MNARILFLLSAALIIPACGGSSGGGGGTTLPLVDMTFGASGKTAVGTSPVRNDVPTSITLDGSRILIAGLEEGGAEPYSMQLRAINDDGTPDTSFGGGDGVIKHLDPTSPGDDYLGTAVAVDGLGRILVAGFNGWSFTLGAMVWRFDANGNPDLSFGTNGIANDPAGFIIDMVLDGAGNIYVAGSRWNGTDRDMAVWKLDSTGSLDLTFGGGLGYIMHPSAAGGTSDDAAEEIVFDGAGNLVVAGYSTDTGGDEDTVVWRMDTDGNLDPTFGGTGFVVVDHPTFDRAYAVDVDGTGRIVAVGYVGNDAAAWRWDSLGNADASFGGGGEVILAGAGGAFDFDEAHALLFDSVGRILVGGSQANGTDADMKVWALFDSGAVDGSFQVSYNSGTGMQDTARAMMFDASGRLVVTGITETASGDFDIMVWRYQ